MQPAESFLRIVARDQRQAGQQRAVWPSWAASDPAGYTVTRLNTLLQDALKVDSFIDLAMVRRVPPVVPFTLGAVTYPQAPALSPFLPPELTGMQVLLPWARRKHAEAVVHANDLYQQALAAHDQQITAIKQRIAFARDQHDQAVADIVAKTNAWNAEVDAFAQAVVSGQPQAVADYFALVLEVSLYPLSTRLSATCKSGLPSRVETIGGGV